MLQLLLQLLFNFLLTLLTFWGLQGDVQSAASVQAIARQVCEQLIQSESRCSGPVSRSEVWS